jgi:uncharacterized membrane protein YeiH
VLIGQFHIHPAFDLSATFLLAVTGALAGMRKGYDLVGVTVLALVAGVGGALLRDGIFLQQVPVVVTDAGYLLAVLGGAAAAVLFGRQLHRMRLAISVVDALGLGVYAVVGAQKALLFGLPAVAAVLIGAVNAVGGGLLRDVLVREEPFVFKPGEFYALAALAGAVCFTVLAAGLQLPAGRAALASIAVAVGARLASIRLGWRTGAFADGDATP